MSGSRFPGEPFPAGERVDADGPAVRAGPPYRIENSGDDGQEVYSYVDRVDTTRSQTVETYGPNHGPFGKRGVGESGANEKGRSPKGPGPSVIVTR